jgi:hypothetical protein
LWPFPLEQSSFGKRFAASSRDLSFHLHCQRRVALNATAKAVVPTLPAANIRLMTDPFAEDQPGPGSMQGLHEALVADKVVPSGHHGGKWIAEPSDFMSMFQDASAFLFLGFGRFLGGVGLQNFVSADLRNMQTAILISNTVNDASFRRQTKFDSNKTRAELELESPYMSAVFASFRGISSILQMAHPLPIPLAIRGMDHIARSLAKGDPLDAILRSMREITVPANERYERTGRGGTADSKKAKKEKGKDAAEEVDMVPLFPPHSVAAFQLIGIYGIAKA